MNGYLRKRIDKKRRSAKVGPVGKGSGLKFRQKLVLRGAKEEAIRKNLVISDELVLRAKEKLLALSTGSENNFHHGCPGEIQVLWTYAPTFAAMQHFIPNLNGRNVLEVGYGGPLFLRVMKKLGATTAGCQTHNHLVEEKEAKFLNLHENINVENLPYKNRSFDAVVCKDVLREETDFIRRESDTTERERQFERAIQSTRKVLKKGGFLFIQNNEGEENLSKEMIEKNGLRIIFRGFVGIPSLVSPNNPMHTIHQFLIIAKRT